MNILIKPKGDKYIYAIPFEQFIEPFVCDMDLFKQRCSEFLSFIENLRSDSVQGLNILTIWFIM